MKWSGEKRNQIGFKKGLGKTESVFGIRARSLCPLGSGKEEERDLTEWRVSRENWSLTREFRGESDRECATIISISRFKKEEEFLNILGGCLYWNRSGRRAN